MSQRHAAKSGRGFGVLRLTALNRLPHTSLHHIATDFIDTIPCQKVQFVEISSLVFIVVYIPWYHSDSFIVRELEAKNKFFKRPRVLKMFEHGFQ